MPTPPDSDLMFSFLAVADCGSVTAAADRLGRTQSAVSMQIRRLEENLGQSLFERLPRGVALTGRGEQLVPYARRIVGLLDAAVSEMRQRPLDGPVRVGIPQEYCETVLPRVLAEFAERHPAAEVSVRCDYSAPQLKALADGLLDLAIVYDSSPTPAEGEVLMIDPTVWVTSCRHGQHLQSPLPVTSYFRSDWCRDFMIGSLDRHGIAHRIVFECDTTSGFWAALRAGLAVAALARSTIPEGCRELTPAEGFQVIDSTSVVLRRGPGGSSPVIEALAGILRDTFSDTMSMMNQTRSVTP